MAHHIGEASKADYSKLGKLRVLLAEDNELNQYLLRGLMESWGFVVHTADNGIEALELFQKNDYDVLLFDLQMPEMGGMEAMKLIRGYHNLHKCHVPIIALSANVETGEAEKHIAMGFNDFLVKPVEEETLFQQIAVQTSTSLLYKPKTEENKTPETPLQIDRAALLNKFHNNSAFVDHLLKLFVETTPEALAALRLHHNNQDFEKLQAAAHKLKTTIDTFKIVTLQETIRKIESYAGQKSDLEQLSELINHTTEVLMLIIDRLDHNR
ncbi:MAG TPA: response regulator [Cytophagales bacterium]|nr:response regulator [Cytophagales bacterium]